MVPAASPTVPAPSSEPIAPVPSGLPAVPQVPVPTTPTSVPTDIPVLNVQSIPPPTQVIPQAVTSGQPNNSLMSPSGSGLLFDPSIIGSLPVVTPVPPIDQSAAGTVVPPGGAPTVQPTGLTRSDSLAAVIADLNQTLAQSSVSNGEWMIQSKIRLDKYLWLFLDIPVTTPFQTASSLFSAESGDPESSSAFDQISK